MFLWQSRVLCLLHSILWAGKGCGFPADPFSVVPFSGITQCQCSNGTWRPFDQIPLRKSSPRKIKPSTRFLLPASSAARVYLIRSLSLHRFALGSQAELFGKLATLVHLDSPDLLGTPLKGFGSVPYVFRVSQRADFRIRRGWCNLRAACGDQTLTRKPPNRTTASSVTRARICSSAITSGGTICQVRCWTRKGCVIASGV